MSSGVHHENKIIKNHVQRLHHWWTYLVLCLLQVEYILKISCSGRGPNPNLPNFVNTNMSIITCRFLNKEAYGLPPFLVTIVIVFIRINVVYSLLFIYVMYSHFSTNNQHPYGTSCVPLLAYLFLSSYEVEFIQKRIRQDHYEVINPLILLSDILMMFYQLIIQTLLTTFN